MKRIFTLIVIVLVAYSFHTKAQSTRLVLAEEFTQASCPPCASQNPAFNNLLNANATKVVAIKYQTSWPGVDPMNDQTQTWVGPRVTYYGVNGVPTGCMDGQEQRGSSYTGAPANWTQAKLNTRQLVSSPYDLVVSHTFNASMDSMHISATMTCTQADSGELVLQIAVIEREIPFCHDPGTNGENVFEGVMRTMVPGYQGTVLATNWTVGQTQTFNFDIKVPDYVYDKNTLAVVGFIQDNKMAASTSITASGLSSTTITVGSSAGISVGMYVFGTGLGAGRVITAISGNTLTLSSASSNSVQVSGTGTFYLKDVRQAAYSSPQPLANDAKIDCDGLTNVPLVSCGNAISPSVTFKNMGTASLTGLSLDYWIDGVAQTAIPWTGTVAPGATASISIPSSGINTTVGNHTLKVAVTQPNSTTDYNVLEDSASAMYIVTPSQGMNLPLEEAFASSSFPYANWNIYNPDGGPTWTRVTAGLNSTGSTKMDFYNSGDGQIDELYVPNYDFSLAGTTTAQIDFDVAYCQYNTLQDRLQVLYSTDCGANWTSIYNEAGSTLASGNPASTSAFTPTSASQWHHKTASLNAVAGSSNVYVKFMATSNYGNNLYVDNINITTNMLTSAPTLANDKQISVYPNPSKGMFNIQMNFDNSQDVTVTVTNSLGAVVKTMKLANVTSDVLPVDMTDAAKGTYEISVVSSTNVITKRISITE